MDINQAIERLKSLEPDKQRQVIEKIESFSRESTARSGVGLRATATLRAEPFDDPEEDLSESKEAFSGIGSRK